MGSEAFDRATEVGKTIVRVLFEGSDEPHSGAVDAGGQVGYLGLEVFYLVTEPREELDTSRIGGAGYLELTHKAFDGAYLAGRS